MKQGFTPYLPLNEYVPDAEPHVFGDRVYIYGSHDKEDGDTFCMLDYVSYSASCDDLTSWRYEGVIYRASQDPDYRKKDSLYSPVVREYMYAPDVVRGNDTIFIIVCLAAMARVAITVQSELRSVINRRVIMNTLDMCSMQMELPCWRGYVLIRLC